MEATSAVNADVFGLYELAKDGTVLYSRARLDGGLTDAKDGVVGRDFFREIFHCQNIEDLRSHFRRFITGDRSVDNFVFDCFFEREVIRAKVFMTRAFESDYERAGGIVIMDIRRDA